MSSQSLVNLLIYLKQYDAAAEVVSVSQTSFAVYSRLIDEEIRRAQEIPEVAFTVTEWKMKRILETAQAEIDEHRQWQESVLEHLPKEDDESGLTAPLRQAFSESAADSATFMRKIISAHKEWWTLHIKYIKTFAEAHNQEEALLNSQD